MKLTFTISFLLSLTFAATAQTISGNYKSRSSAGKSTSGKVNLNGQWRGSFNEGTGSTMLTRDAATTYVLELTIDGNAVSGYSYTYFSDIGPKRYYTICRITGTADRQSNSVIVTEVERIRYNTPPYILNCFQVHRLRFEKEGNTEYLKGDWWPAPNQTCSGKGETVLSRETPSRTPFAVKLPPRKDEVAKSSRPAPSRQQTTRAPVKAEKPREAAPDRTTTVPAMPVEKQPSKDFAEKKMVLDMPPAPVHKGYENRRNEVVKTIRIQNPVFQVDFYDNGEIDGDTISVFYNGKLILSHKMLTAQPLTLTLSVDKNYKNNVITMYAENLGSIPPNTAVMIVRDGDRRYEVRMESDLGKSGSVLFRHDD